MSQKQVHDKKVDEALISFDNIMNKYDHAVHGRGSTSCEKGFDFLLEAAEKAGYVAVHGHPEKQNDTFSDKTQRILKAVRDDIVQELVDKSAVPLPRPGPFVRKCVREPLVDNDTDDRQEKRFKKLELDGLGDTTGFHLKSIKGGWDKKGEVMLSGDIQELHNNFVRLSKTKADDACGGPVLKYIVNGKFLLGKLDANAKSIPKNKREDFVDRIDTGHDNINREATQFMKCLRKKPVIPDHDDANQDPLYRRGRRLELDGVAGGRSLVVGAVVLALGVTWWFSTDWTEHPNIPTPDP
jgi:hypothetical protein